MAFAHQHFQTHKYPHHIQVIDGLRAIGIMLVVWYHLWLQTWIGTSVSFLGQNISFGYIPATGYIGVDILLFISGFGLFYPYALHVIESEKLQSLGEFAYHRFIRIVPSYYLVLIAAVFIFTVESAVVKDNMLWQLFTHLTFIHIFFAETQGAIGGVLWTLGTEAQFYLVFPLLAWAFMKKPIWTFLAMVGVAYIFRLHAIGQNFDNLEFWTRQAPAFFDIYASGMLAAFGLVFLQNRIKLGKLTTIAGSIISILSFIAFLICLQQLYQTDLAVQSGRYIWLSNNRLLEGLILMLFVISASFSFRALRFLLTNKLMIFISVISYNLYLWHGLIILELKDKHIPNWIGPDPHNDPNWQILFFILALISSLVTATLLTYLFERPIVKRALLLKFG